MKSAPSPESGLCGQDLAVPCGVMAVDRAQRCQCWAGTPRDGAEWATSVSGVRAAAASQKSVPRFY